MGTLERYLGRAAAASIIAAACLAAASCSDESSPAGPGNRPPRVPASPVPFDGAVYGAALLDLAWECSDPDNDAIVFSVIVREIGVGDTFTVFGAQTPFYTMKTGMALLRETSYIWRVAASDGREVTLGPWWRFVTPKWTNAPPYAPSDPTPAHGSTGVSTDAYLTWTASDPDADDYLTFELFFGDSEPPPLEASGLNQTSYELPDLQYGTEYFWRVVSTDSRDESTAGPVWSFTTAEQPGLLSRIGGVLGRLFDR